MSSAAEKRHLHKIKLLPCSCCGQSGPSDAHHIREGQGMGQKASDSMAIPLCKSCHQGDYGIHGDRSMLRIMKTDELGLLAKTIEKLVSV